MKFNIFLLIFILFFYGCAKKDIKKDVVKPETKIENNSKNEPISIGWSDLNTYTVKVVAENLEKGKEKAKHQILQDIVKVRMMNESRFTDITKINSEFEKPLKKIKCNIFLQLQ